MIATVRTGIDQPISNRDGVVQEHLKTFSICYILILNLLNYEGKIHYYVFVFQINTCCLYELPLLISTIFSNFTTLIASSTNNS